MKEHWLKTNEHEEAVSALEMAAEFSGRIQEQVDSWRWVVLALHNSLQGFMVLALRGTDGLRPLRDDIAKKWLAAHRKKGEYPVEKLDSFLNLYKKIKSKKMLFYGHSKRFVPNGHQTQHVKELNSLRNEFIHFLPKSWALELSGLPEICLDCMGVIEFLAFDCGNVHFYEDERRRRTEKALRTARSSLERIQDCYLKS